jgi:hypothetical protein
MWTLSKVLKKIESHVPSGFNAKNGIRSLFPAGYSGSIQSLSGYVFCNYFRTSALDATGKPCNSDLWVMADGTGRWFFGWAYGKSQANGFRIAGFVFHAISTDGAWYGYIDGNSPLEEITSCNLGTSAIIADNWPAMFKAGASIHFRIYPPNTPAFTPIWKVGKTAIVLLDGNNVAPEASQSGSLLFPLPSIGPDVYVAGLAAGWHTKFILYEIPPINPTIPPVPPVSAQRIRSFIDTPNFNSPAKASILGFLTTSAADKVVSNAMLVAEQTYGGFLEKPPAPLPTLGEPGGLSIEVTASQILAAATTAYQVMQGPSSVVPYNFLEFLTTNVLAQPPVGSSPHGVGSSGPTITDIWLELLDLVSRALAGNAATGGEAEAIPSDLLQELGAWLLAGLANLEIWSITPPDPMGEADAGAAARQVNLPGPDDTVSSPDPSQQLISLPPGYISIAPNFSSGDDSE